MFHFHLERKVLKRGREALHLFLIDANGGRIGLADRVAPRAAVDALEETLRRGTDAVRGCLTVDHLTERP